MEFVAELLLRSLLLLLQETQLPQLLAPTAERRGGGYRKKCMTGDRVKRTIAKMSKRSPGEGPRSYLRNLISSFLVSLSVMIFDVVTLTSTPSTMNLRVFFSVFL